MLVASTGHAGHDLRDMNSTLKVLKAGSRHTSIEATLGVQETVTAILADLKANGEVALREHSLRLDGWNPASFVLPEAETERLAASIDDALREEIDFAAEGIRAFAEAQLGTLSDLDAEIRPGVRAGHRRLAVDRVAAYVPGGRYQLVTSSLMTVIPARVAGVSDVTAVIAPAGVRGPSPAAVYAARIAGADRICSIGGVQALGSMAYGLLEGVAPVDMLVGAGNAYVAEAKRQLFGTVGIDLLAGPSEILVIADETADPEVVALDLLSQAEHGATTATALLSTSESVAAAVMQAVDSLLASLPTAEVAGAAWREYGTVMVGADRDALVYASDDFAAEHVLLQVADAGWYHERLRNYGSIFLNARTSVAFGDKATGPNHTLPTQRAARYTAGLGVERYLRTLTFHDVGADGVAPLVRATAAISRAEGMEGHALAAEARTPGGTPPA
jgi:sulfopropanediol 3-dehydrogenase